MNDRPIIEIRVKYRIDDEQNIRSVNVHGKSLKDLVYSVRQQENNNNLKLYSRYDGKILNLKFDLSNLTEDFVFLFINQGFDIEAYKNSEQPNRIHPTEVSKVKIDYMIKNDKTRRRIIIPSDQNIEQFIGLVNTRNKIQCKFAYHDQNLIHGTEKIAGYEGKLIFIQYEQVKPEKQYFDELMKIKGQNTQKGSMKRALSQQVGYVSPIPEKKIGKPFKYIFGNTQDEEYYTEDLENFVSIMDSLKKRFKSNIQYIYSLNTTTGKIGLVKANDKPSSILKDGIILVFSSEKRQIIIADYTKYLNIPSFNIKYTIDKSDVKVIKWDSKVGNLLNDFVKFIGRKTNTEIREVRVDKEKIKMDELLKQYQDSVLNLYTYNQAIVHYYLDDSSDVYCHFINAENTVHELIQEISNERNNDELLIAKNYDTHEKISSSEKVDENIFYLICKRNFSIFKDATHSEDEFDQDCNSNGSSDRKDAFFKTQYINSKLNFIDGISKMRDIPNDGKFKLYTTANTNSFFDGTLIDIGKNNSFEEIKSFLLQETQKLNHKTEDITIFLAGGLIFNHGSIQEFYNLMPSASKVFYVIAHRKIPNNSHDEMIHIKLNDPYVRFLLSPLRTSAEQSLSTFVCQLGYLIFGGRKRHLFNTNLSYIVPFAPLLISIRNFINEKIYWSDLLVIGGSLHVVYSFLLDGLGIKPENVFQYSLECACYITHIEQQDIAYLKKFEYHEESHDELSNYIRSNREQYKNNSMYVYGPDINGDIVYISKVLKISKDLLKNMFKEMKTFKPMGPLDLNYNLGTVVFTDNDRNMYVYLRHDQNNKDKVECFNPINGNSEMKSITELSKEMDATSAMDPYSYTELITICVDTSKSMNSTFVDSNGNYTGFNRITVALQFLTMLIHNLHEFKIQCCYSLYSFNRIVDQLSKLSPQISNIEEALNKLIPNSYTKLWDCIDQAADQTVQFSQENGCEQAIHRILVLSDGGDAGSSTNPTNLAKKLIKNKIIVDAVVLAADKGTPKLIGLCQATGGMAVYPETIESGLELFEQEAFLSLIIRKASPPLNEELINDDYFENTQHKYNRPDDIIHQTRMEISGPQNKIDSVAAVLNRHHNNSVQRLMEEIKRIWTAQNENLKVYLMNDCLYIWKVYIKGPEDTPYAGKWWDLLVKFESGYPNNAPDIRFISVPFHVNVTTEGRICMKEMSEYHSYDHIIDIIRMMIKILKEPNLKYPVQITKFIMLKQDPEEYNRLACEHTLEYGIPDSELSNFPPSDEKPRDKDFDDCSISTVANLRTHTGAPIHNPVRGDDGAFHEQYELQYLLSHTDYNPLMVGSEVFSSEQYDMDDFII